MTAPGDDQVDLTDEQRGPVEARAVSIALAAGAGCGKTTVLTERFLGEIDGGNGRALRALAAMTFTEKAARELRQRIRARCRAKLAAGVDPRWWTLVLRALEAAPIGTFHEFCGRLLRSRADKLGLDPEFAILDEIIAASLRERATASAIRRLLADRDPDLLTLGVDYGLRTTREMLETILAQRSPDEIEPFYEATAEDLVARWRTGWTDRGRPATLAKIGPAARRCQSVLMDLPAELSPKLALVRRAALDGLAALASPACSDGALDALREAAKITTLRGKNDWPDADAKALVGDAFKSLRAAIDGATAKMAWDDAVTLEAAETTIRLARVAREVRRDYDELKGRHHGLDFADLIAQTRAALREAADSRAAAVAADGEIDLDASVIEFILVDEFQDTDAIQSDILRLLGGEGFASGRLFVVGDSKQSIYRFRGAEPAIFGRWRGEFPESGRPRLSENFRTVPRVLHFVNALFAESFAEADGAADPEAIRLSAARADHGDGPAVHFFWVEPPAADPTDDAPAAKLAAKDCRVREAEALAGWLRGRLDAGWPIVDRKTRTPRPAHAGDVALLLRAMTDVWPYETALADQGFDYHTIGGSAFYSQQEVLDIINLLSVIEDPLDELALAGTLRGPFFSMTDEGLYWLSRTPGGLIAGLDRADEVPGLSDGDRARAARARRLLARWRDLKDHAPMASLLARALDESGFAAALVCEFLGDRKLANVRKLVRTARDFDRRGGFGLADFVGRLRAFADEPPKEEQAAVSEEDGRNVRIMTVHQAKGLEFPIVVLPDLNRSVGPRTSPFGFDRELGLVVKPPGGIDDGEDEGAGAGKSLGWLAHKAIEDREERDEALRLFYVAATRARDQLVLSAGFPKPLGELAVDKLSPALNLVWERFDGPIGRRLARLPDGWPAPEVAVVDTANLDRAQRRGPRRRRPDLQAIISAIETGGRGARSRPRPTPLPPLPRFIDLDGPLHDPSRAGRVAALIRACAVEPGLLGGEPAEAVAVRVGARQAPAANAGRIAEAAASLLAWTAGPFFDRIRKTPAGGVRGPQSWTWRAAPTAEPVVRGSCDALVRADDGGWRPLVFLLPGEPEAWARARAALSLATLPMKLGPAWLIRLGPDGKIQTTRHDRPTDDEVQRMLRGCLENAI